MPGTIRVRPATPADAGGISAVYTGSDLPCTNPAEWAVHTNHRLLEGFLIDVALIGKRIVGHAEWLVSDEPAPYGRHLYLGMLEVHPKSRGRGAGRALVEAGIAKARALGCPIARTMSERDARVFYRKCGFVRSGRAASGSAKLRSTPMPKGWRPGRTVPRAVIGELPMRLGWAQACSAHMWSIANRPTLLAGEEPSRHPCARHVDGKGYVQVRYCPQAGRSGLVIAWAPRSIRLKTLCSVAMALADGLPIDRLTLMTDADDRADLARSCDAAPRTGANDEIWSKPTA